MFKFVKDLFGSQESEEIKESQDGEAITESKGSAEGFAEGAEVKVKLSLPNDNADPVADWVLKEMQEDLASLPPIREGEVVINGIYTFRNSSEEQLKVRCFVRNGAAQAVHFSEVALAIVNSEDEVVARQVFNLGGLGEIPAGGARPFDVYFAAHAVLAPIPKEGWRIVFGIREPMTFMDLTHFNEDERHELERFLAGLPPVGEGQVNFFPVRAQLVDGGLAATVLIRNGSEQNVRFETLKLAVLNGENRMLCSGMFEPADLNIESNKARLWTFNFPADSVQAGPDDLTQWSLALIE